MVQINSGDKLKFERSEVALRRLVASDFLQFKRAAIESVESNLEYLWFGKFFDQANLVEIMNEYSWLLKDRDSSHFGVFQGSKLLGHVALTRSLFPLGVEIYGWVRKGYHNLGIGEIGLQYAIKEAFDNSGFNFVELHIDSSNISSRRVAEKLGFFPVYKTLGGTVAAEKVFITYIKINRKIELLAKRFNRSSLQIMNCPATVVPYMNYLLQADSLISFYEWPFEQFSESNQPLDEIELHKYLTLLNLGPDDLAYLEIANSG